MKEFAQQYPLDILVAEDVVMNQRVLALLLARLGYSPVLADNGLQVLEKLRYQNFDLILMDLNMPILDGLTAVEQIRKLKSLRKQPYIVALTGHVCPQQRQAVLDRGADGFLAKPIAFEQLKDSLTRFGSQGERRACEGSRTESTMLDLEVIGALRLLGDDEFFRGLVKEACEDFTALLAVAEEELSARRGEQAREQIHCLRGAAATVGASGLAQVAAHMEFQLRGGELDGAAHELPQLRSIAAQTLEQLRNLTASA